MARAIAAPVLLFAALVLAGCASNGNNDSDSTSQTSTSSGTTVSVSGSVSVSTSSTGGPGSKVTKMIHDDSFPDGNFTIHVGDTVNWTSMGQHPHSVTSDTGLFDSSPGCTSATSESCLHSGDSYEHRFMAPGTFSYHCSVHPTTMTGTITVVQ